MNLSPFLLSAAENESEPASPSIVVAAKLAAQPVLSQLTGTASNDASRWPGAVYEPSRVAGRVLHQASYRNRLSAQSDTHRLQAWVFSASVLANAVGFLLMTSGLFLLLQVAADSLI